MIAAAQAMLPGECGRTCRSRMWRLGYPIRVDYQSGVKPHKGETLADQCLWVFAENFKFGSKAAGLIVPVRTPRASACCDAPRYPSDLGQQSPSKRDFPLFAIFRGYRSPDLSKASHPLTDTLNSR